MIDQEAQGIRARIGIVDRDIEKCAGLLKAASGDHWRDLHQAALFDAMRRRDILVGKLDAIAKQGRIIK